MTAKTFEEWISPRYTPGPLYFAGAREAWHARDAEVRALVEAGKWFRDELTGLSRTDCMTAGDWGGDAEYVAHAATLAQYAEGGKDG